MELTVKRYCSARSILCWISFFLLASPFVSHCTEPCSNGENCQQAKNGTLPEADEYLYRMGTRTTGYKAVDICFVVAATTTMSGSQRWIQIFVPLLELHLVRNGVGNTTDNRYCLVQFGSRGRFLTARFLLVNGEIFFRESQFVMARRQLKRNGDIADGYEALDFTLTHAPFRDDPHIAKHVVIITNMGRSTLATAAALTRESMLNQLKMNNITLDAIVEADFAIRPNETNAVTAIGLNSYRSAAIVRPGGSFELAEGEVLYDSHQGQTIHDYVTLALDTGGSSWSIQLFALEDYNILDSAMQAFTAAHDMVQLNTLRVCEKCVCMSEQPEGLATTENCNDLLCEVPTDQEKCRCTIDDTPPECVELINPTPVIPAVTSVLAPSGPMETPLPLLLDGMLSQFPGGDVELEFTSERSNAQYYCFLMPSDSDSPIVSPCISPYYMKNLTSGPYQLLLFGKRKAYIGSRVFKFHIPSEQEEVPPHISLRALPDANSSMAVIIMTEGFARSNLTLLCSIGGADFFPCSSPHILHHDEIGNNGVQFVAIATDSRGRAAAGMLLVERPVMPTPPMSCSPLMIMNISAEPPDLFGRIVIHFNTSCSEVHCICRTNTTNTFCLNEFQADPRELGVGTHDITISCMDYEGFVDTKNIKIPLQMPPRPPTGPLSCDLRVMGPTEHSILVAVFTCDRRVISRCQVSSLPLQPCNTPNGVYEVDVSSLEPGPHLFILNVDDGYGKTLMKIVPFTIGTAHRKCCPNISRNSTAMQLLSTSQVNLDLSVTAGNCSDTEGFSYTINWGDGASETGTTEDLTPIRSSRVYDSHGDYVIELSYCNNPAMEANVCCESLNLPVHLQPQ